MSTPPRGCLNKRRTKVDNTTTTAATSHSHSTQSPRTPPVNRDHHHHHHGGPHAMSVLVTRVDLYDSGFTTHTHNHTQEETNKHSSTLLDVSHPPVAPYSFHADNNSSTTTATASTKPPNHERLSVAICRIPPVIPSSPVASHWMEMNLMDNITPSPNPNITKYWNQRRRLFSRFDHGIELDAEGWFSVTPEQIADHVTQETQRYYNPRILLDAFCGCGGNAIAFAKRTKVVAIDVDRQKLRKAAHNARLYGIAPENLVLVECNVLFVLEYCYKAGQFVLDQPIASPEKAMALMEAMPPPVTTEIYEGYQIGGIDLLPRDIDAIFMDPPWGGIDYEVFGKHGYDLEHNMKIERPSRSVATVQDDFFDSFAVTNRNKQERKAHFNCTIDDSNCVNGVELLQLAAAATPSVLYDVPRNTRRQSLGQAALAAGYRGNCLWEEHFLNTRLKTVTVYFGRDWRSLTQTTARTTTTTTSTTTTSM